MTLNKLKERVYNCNMELYNKGLAIQTFGNVSGLDRESGILAIKPSGVPYKELKVENIVLVDLNNRIIEGKLNPSSDTKTHIVLYKAFPQICGVVHTHSPYATAWAQAGIPIMCFGTTHADYVQGEILCTKTLSQKQINKDYEIETGNQIVKRLKGLSYEQIQMILVAGHGPFTWGKDPESALHNSFLLEEIAKIAMFTKLINPGAKTISTALLNKHFTRKHGVNSYYGQKPRT
jgi:L-ribulose-5-phosphate 4-epimerase